VNCNFHCDRHGPFFSALTSADSFQQKLKTNRSSIVGHSAVGVPTITWLGFGLTSKEQLYPVPFIALLAACLSHLALDLLVGAYPVPLFWPHANPNVAIPLGTEKHMLMGFLKDAIARQKPRTCLLQD
jgi:membrane-bound metal-dependent hydrolase YbcI (DUF457 family)